MANLSTGERASNPTPATWSAGDNGVVIAVSDGMGGATRAKQPRGEGWARR